MMPSATVNRLRISGPPPSEESVNDTRRALQQGVELLASEGLSSPTLRAVIWRLTEEAVETLARLPDREQSWLYANQRSIWPELARPREDCRKIEWEIAMEQLAGVRGRDSSASMPRFAISDPSAIDRMLVVLGWMRYFRSKNMRRDRIVFLELASKTPPRFIKRHFWFGCSDGTLRAVKERGLQHIGAALLPYAKELTFSRACANLR